MLRPFRHVTASLGQAWQNVTWREVASGPLSSRFARVRVRAAHRDQPRDEEWLIIEWAEGAKEPAHYWFSNMSTRTAWPEMAETVMSRWRKPESRVQSLRT